MKKTSTIKVFLKRDRSNIVEEHVQIHIWQEKKDPDSKMYTIKTKDVIVRNLGEDNESTEQIYDIHGGIQEKSYYTSYADYDMEKAQLLEMFPTELQGSELDDYLLLKKLELSLELDPVYGLAGNQWE